MHLEGWPQRTNSRPSFETPRKQRGSSGSSSQNFAICAQLAPRLHAELQRIIATDRATDRAKGDADVSHIFKGLEDPDDGHGRHLAVRDHGA
jgi:hypothetical protein